MMMLLKALPRSPTPHRSCMKSFEEMCSHKEWTKDDDRGHERSWNKNLIDALSSLSLSCSTLYNNSWSSCDGWHAKSSAQKKSFSANFGENLCEFVLVVTWEFTRQNCKKAAEHETSPTNYHAKVIDRECLYHLSVAVGVSATQHSKRSASEQKQKQRANEINFQFQLHFVCVEASILNSFEREPHSRSLPCFNEIT